MAGVTGQLGQGIVEAAAESGDEIVPVVRRMARREPARRLERLFPDRPELAERVLEGDVTLPRWGLDDGALDRLASEVDAVLNVAAETNWAAPARRLAAVNVLGGIGGAEVAAALRARHPRCGAYCYASSVHTAGGREGRVPETPFGPDRYRTPYEHSKWIAERALLDPVRQDGGISIGIARVGGLLGNSKTGATAKRNSLYLLADRWERLPGKILPLAGRGRIDMLPRDLAGRLLLRFAGGVLRLALPDPQLAHVCAGESAPTAAALFSTLRSLDHHGAGPRGHTAPVPVSMVRWISGNLDRFHDLPTRTRNMVVGMRYLAFDRVFERARLSRLVSGPLPAPSVETLARLAFELPSNDPSPWEVGPHLARFRG